MISPCECKGTSKWVHVECFVKWILKSPSPGKCEICNTKYIETESPPPAPVPTETFFDSTLFLEDVAFIMSSFFHMTKKIASF